MTITLLMIGKTSEKYIEEGSLLFINRLKHYAKIAVKVIPDIKERKNLTPEQVKEKEADLILPFFEPGNITILLDEHGKEFRSVDFADWLQKLYNTNAKNITFIIGGAYGVSERIKQKANHIIALSRMTFTHQFIRLLLAEQLYRAMTILNHEPYHNE